MIIRKVKQQKYRFKIFYQSGSLLLETLYMYNCTELMNSVFTRLLKHLMSIFCIIWPYLFYFEKPDVFFGKPCIFRYFLIYLFFDFYNYWNNNETKYIYISADKSCLFVCMYRVSHKTPDFPNYLESTFRLLNVSSLSSTEIFFNF